MASTSTPGADDLDNMIATLLREALAEGTYVRRFKWESTPIQTLRDIALRMHVGVVLLFAAAPPPRSGSNAQSPPCFNSPESLLQWLNGRLSAIRASPLGAGALRNDLIQGVRALGDVQLRTMPSTDPAFHASQALLGGRVFARYLRQPSEPMLRQLLNLQRRTYLEPLPPVSLFPGHALVLEAPPPLVHSPKPGRWAGAHEPVFEPWSFPRIWLAACGVTPSRIETWRAGDPDSTYFRVAAELAESPFGSLQHVLGGMIPPGEPPRDLVVLPALAAAPRQVDDLAQELLPPVGRTLGIIAGLTHQVAMEHEPWVLNRARVLLQDGDERRDWYHQKRGPFRIKEGKVRESQSLSGHRPPGAAEDIWEGLVPGRELRWINMVWGRLGVLICADLLEERWTSLRDLVRLARLDILIAVCLSEKTAPFVAHAEQLARLGVGSFMVNHPVTTPACRAQEDQVPEPWSAYVRLPSWGGESDGRPNAFCWSRAHPENLWARTTGTPWKRIAREEGERLGVRLEPKVPALVVDLDVWRQSGGQGAEDGATGGGAEGRLGDMSQAPSAQATHVNALTEGQLLLLDQLYAAPLRSGPVPSNLSAAELFALLSSGMFEVTEPLAYDSPPQWRLTLAGLRRAQERHPASPSHIHDTPQAPTEQNRDSKSTGDTQAWQGVGRMGSSSCSL